MGGTEHMNCTEHMDCVEHVDGAERVGSGTVKASINQSRHRPKALQLKREQRPFLVQPRVSLLVKKKPFEDLCQMDPVRSARTARSARMASLGTVGGSATPRRDTDEQAHIFMPLSGNDILLYKFHT